MNSVPAGALPPDWLESFGADAPGRRAGRPLERPRSPDRLHGAARAAGQRAGTGARVGKLLFERSRTKGVPGRATRHHPRMPRMAGPARGLVVCALLGAAAPGCGGGSSPPVPSADAAARLRAELSELHRAADGGDVAGATRALDAFAATVAQERAAGRLTAPRYAALETGIARARARIVLDVRAPAAPAAPAPTTATPVAPAVGKGGAHGKGKPERKAKGHGGHKGHGEG